MSALRLLCNVFVASDREFPADDEHPFWLALDAMGDAVAASVRARGLDPDALEAMSESDDGSTLTISSDAPSWAMRFWVDLPRDAGEQAALLPLLLEHLADARVALDDAKWDVKFGDRPLIWDGGRFQIAS